MPQEVKYNISLKFLVLGFIFYLQAHALFAISSTPAGGAWQDTLTWIGGVVPTSTDDVVINGPVTIFNHVYVDDFTMNSNGSVANTNGSSRNIVVNGNFVNYGNITSDNFKIVITGNIINNGTIEVNIEGAGDVENNALWTGDLTIVGVGNHYVDGVFIGNIQATNGGVSLLKGDNFSLQGLLNLADNTFDARNGILEIKNEGQIVNGNIINLRQLNGINCTKSSTATFSPGTSGLITFSGEVYLFTTSNINGNLNNTGNLKIETNSFNCTFCDFEIRGNLSNSGAIYKVGGTRSLIIDIDGNTINSGTITAAITYLSGHLEDNGDINLDLSMFLDGNTIQDLDISVPISYYIQSENTAGRIDVNSPITTNSTIYLNGDTLNLNANQLTLQESGVVHSGLIFNAKDINGVNCVNPSEVGIISTPSDTLTFSGEVYLLSYTNITGTLHNRDTLKIGLPATGCSFSLCDFDVVGDLINTGHIYKEGGLSGLALDINGDLNNKGTITAAVTYLSGHLEDTGDINLDTELHLDGIDKQNLNVSIPIDYYIQSDNVMGRIDVLNPLTTNSTIYLNGDTLNLNAHQLILQSSGNVHSGLITNVRELIGFQSTFYSTVSLYAAPSGDEIVQSGDFKLHGSSQIYGDYQNNDTLSIASTNRNNDDFRIFGNYKNFGITQRGAGDFSLKMYVTGDIYNYGEFQSMYRLYADGDTTQYIYLVGDSSIHLTTQLNANIAGSNFTWFKNGSQIGSGDHWILNEVTSADYGEYVVVSDIGDSRKIIIKRKVIVHRIVPEIAGLHQRTTFIVLGLGLLDEMEYHIDDCSDIQELDRGTGVFRQFSCTPTQLGWKNGLIREELAGDTVHVFQVLVVEEAPLVEAVSPRYVVLGDTVNFIISGQYLTDSLLLKIENFDLIDTFSVGDKLSQTMRLTSKDIGLYTGEVRDSTAAFLLHLFEVEVFSIPDNCNWTDLDADHWAYKQIRFLCGLEIVTGDGMMNTVRPDDFLNRAELAKAAYIGAGIKTKRASYFPNPYNDLQDPSQWYHTYALALSYLTYDDDVSPFARDSFNFYPSHFISKEKFLRVIIETWNIPLKTSSSHPFIDIQNDAYLNYIHTAYELGLLQHFEELGDSLDAKSFITRAEAFDILYRLLQNGAIKQPSLKDTDFFIPENYTPSTLSMHPGLSHGNFSNYTKTSFSIPGIGFPLVFEHFYNSYLTELPDEFFQMRPLGVGWSHTYNAYILEIKGDEVYGEDKVVIFWPDATIHIYVRTPDGSFSCQGIGVYDQLEWTGTSYQITTKQQVVYTFKKPSNDPIHERAPFLLDKIEDRNGNQISLQYEFIMAGAFRLQKVIDESNRALVFGYNGTEFLIRTVTDPINRTIHFNYNEGYSGNIIQANSDLTSFTDAENQTTRYQYYMETGKEHLLQRITLPKGNKIDNQYEQRKLRSTQNSATGLVLDVANTYSYTQGEDNFNSGTITDAMGRKTIITRNKNSLPSQIRSPKGTSSFVYETPQQMHLPSQITQENGLNRSIQYDDFGNPIRIELSLGVIHQFEYNEWSDVTKYTDPRNHETIMSYDASGNLILITTPESRTTVFEVNSQGLITKITNPVNAEIRFTYDNHGNVLKTDYPLNLSSSASYDAASRLLAFTNPKQQRTQWTHTNNDLLESITDALLYTTDYFYDDNDNLTEIVNAKGNTTRLTYDENDFLTNQSFGDYMRSQTYFNDGKLATINTPNGHTFNHTYDPITGQLLNDGYASYTYNLDNTIASIAKDGKTIYFGYDELKRITFTLYGTEIVFYTYDPAGNVKTITYGGDKTVTYTYDKDNLLLSVSDWNGNTTSYTYRADATLKTITYPNNITTTYGYDALSRVNSILTLKAPNDTIYYADFTLDELGNHIALTEINSANGLIELTALEQINTYDDENRIISSTGNSGINHDDNGNILINNGIVHTFDTKNKLTSRGSTTYETDGLGHRRSKNENGTITNYVLDVFGMGNVLMEKEGIGIPQNYYVYGLGLVARIDASGAIRYYHGDYRGSTIAMTDENGELTHQYAYGPFGESWVAEEEDFNSFRYVGLHGVQYEEDNFYFMRARYYDATLGRFISEDPIWNVNLYAYAGNNPMTNIDPNGAQHWNVRDYLNGNYDKYNNMEHSLSSSSSEYLRVTANKAYKTTSKQISPTIKQEENIRPFSREELNRNTNSILRGYEDFNYKNPVDWIASIIHQLYTMPNLLFNGAGHFYHTIIDMKNILKAYWMEE